MDAGFECEIVPSVTEVDHARVESTRRAILLVNPIPLLGGDRVFPIAAARPDLSFVIQESGLLTPSERDAVHHAAARHANVEIRPFAADPAAVFRDARLLLVPHRVDNRPRVVLEAQTNGIPVIASDHPGLVESVGPGGTIVEDTDDPVPWVRAVSDALEADRYERLVAAAREHARRPEVDPDHVVDRFEALVTELIRTGVRRGC